MPNRILREGIVTSSNVAKLTWPEEVMYRRLMSVVDDFGRYYGDPGMIRAACYPRQLNKVSDSDVGKWLHGCAAAGLVRVYPAQDGEKYVELVKFGQQVRAKKSKYPDPTAIDSNCKQPPANEHLDVSVFVSVSEDVSVDSPAAQAQSGPPLAFVGDANAAQIPDKSRVLIAGAWELPTEWGEDSEKLGWTGRNILHQAEKYRQYWTVGKGAGTRRSVKGWRQSWSNWLGKAESMKGIA